MGTPMEISEGISTIKQSVDDLAHLRQIFESQSHWYARKAFLRHHWDTFQNKDRLICLSTAWANVQFMGNRYPDKVMKQLKKMEVDIPPCYELMKEGESEVPEVVVQKKEISESEDLVHDVKKLPTSIKPMMFVKRGMLKDPDLSSETITRLEMSHITPICSKTHVEEKMNIDQGNSANNDASKATDVTLKMTTQKIVAPPLHTLIKNATKKRCKNENAISMKKVKLLPIGKFEKVNVENTEMKSKEKLTSHDNSSSIMGNVNSNEDLSNFIKSLTATLKEHAHKLRETNKISVFYEIIQKLKTKSVFVFSQIKKCNLAQYDAWAKECGSVHSMKYGMWACDLYVHNIFICQGHGSTKISSRNFTINRALDLLNSSQVCVVGAERICEDLSKENQNAVVYNFSLHNKVLFPPLLKSTDVQEFPLRENNNSDSTAQPLKVTKRMLNIHVPKQMVIVERAGDVSIVSYLSTLNQSAQFSHVHIDYIFITNRNGYKCTVTLNETEIASGFSQVKKEAKHLAAEKALTILREKCPCITAPSQRGNLNEATDLKQMCKHDDHNNLSLDKAIPHENVGNKLLRKMGYSGSGGLGKAGVGIATPIKPEGSYNRGGLGHIIQKSGVISFKEAQKVILDYVRNNCTEEMTFAPNLSSDERKKIHQIARKYGLASKSYGKGEQRHLVVFRKATGGEIVNGLVENGKQSFLGYTLKST